MNTFELAKAKYEKKKEKQVQREEAPVKREEPKKVEKQKPMTVMISGPMELVFEVDYQGALLASQLTEEALTALFRKQLSAFGRVR